MLNVTCPDGRTRRARVSDREWRKAGRALRWDRPARVACRVQANGLSVYGNATLNMAGPVSRWFFEPNHGGSPAFYNREGRELAARILLRCAQRLSARGEGAAVFAVLPRVRRLLGLRGR